MTGPATSAGAVTRAALVLAAGVLLATLAAVRLAASGSAVLTAPAIIALALVWAGDIVRRSPTGRPTARRTGIVLGCAVLGASAIVFSKNPGDLALIMPVLGAATAGGLLAVTVQPKGR